MITRKIILAILCTFCVTAVLFTIAPTRTATTTNSTVSSTGIYDPFVDLNHDGLINVLDLIRVATHLGGSGNPTQVVIVQNLLAPSFTNVWDYTNGWLLTGNIASQIYSAQGYSHINLIATTRIPLDAPEEVNVAITWYVSNTYPISNPTPALKINQTNPTIAVSIPLYAPNFSFYVQCNYDFGYVPCVILSFTTTVS